MALGDALALPLDGCGADEIAQRYGWVERFVSAEGDPSLTPTEGAPFSGETELALCTVESVIGTSGYLDLPALGYRAVRLLDGPAVDSLDEPTRQALRLARTHGDFQRGVAGPETRTAGPALRAAVVGLLHTPSHLNPDLFVRDVLRVTLLTHAEPVVVNGALAVAYGVSLLARGTTPPEVLIDEVTRFIDEDDVAARLRRVMEQPLPPEPVAAARALATLGAGPGIDEVVATAFAAFVAAPCDALRAFGIAVNAGGACARRAALVGALLGAAGGVDTLPAPLLDRLAGRPYLVMAARGLFHAALQRSGRMLRLFHR